MSWPFSFLYHSEPQESVLLLGHERWLEILTEDWGSAMDFVKELLGAFQNGSSRSVRK
jgi:hypothetical protein